MNSGEEANLIVSFVGQLFNFIVLFVLLKIFVFKPFSNILEKRRSKIEEGVLKGEKAEKKLEELREIEKRLKLKNEEERKEILAKTEEEARVRKEKTLLALDQVKKEILLNAEKEAEKIKINEQEKTKKEIVSNSIFLAEKLLKEKVDDQKDKELINDYLKNLK
jgi:F-type H+-transporting ATPase subunit b